MSKVSEKYVGIEVEQEELGQMIFSHRDSVVPRIRQMAKDALAQLAAGNYDSGRFLNQISGEIQKSRELFRGFICKKSGKDVCEFIEENFTQEEIRLIFEKMETSFVLSDDADEKKYPALTGYIEIVADEVFSKLIRQLRETEK